jgi:HAD superfamily hydrolase (TIGR01450 family)
MSGHALLDARGWVVDVDGCLVRTASAGGSGGTPIPGAVDFLRGLADAGRDVLVVTNASEQPPATYAAHLRDQGLAVPDGQFLTAGSAAADYITEHHAGAQVLVVGGRGLSEPLEARCMTLAQPTGDPPYAEVVVVGAGRSYPTEVINAACLAVDAGAPLYTTVASPWFHGGLGKSVAISTAIAHAVGWTTGVDPQVLGKPSPRLAETLLRRLGHDPRQITVVGDAPAEIRLAKAMGAHAVLVLSGAMTRADLSELDDEQQPDLVVADLAELHLLITDRLTTAQGAPS